MTYCMGIRLKEGLVFCSDSRTNAGPDRVSTYGKLHRFSIPGERQLMMMTAGNLATSQAVVAQIERDLRQAAKFNISTAEYVSDVADYVGKLGLKEQSKYASGGPGAGFNAEATFILGGQIKGQPTELYMVYPEGNHITVSEQFPFLQIGETKFGKFWLELAAHARVDLEQAIKIALGSMLSTTRANLSVGPPFDLAVYHNGRLTFDEHRIEPTSDYLARIQELFVSHLLAALDELPPIPWEPTGA